MKHFLIFIIAILVLQGATLAQPRQFTLSDVISISKEQSPDAILARHRFRASYWQHRSYVATYLPNLSFTGTLPNLRKTYESHTNDSGEVGFVPIKSISNMGTLSLSQNIGLTGGSIFMESDLQRIKKIGEVGTTQYLSTPVSIGFSQPVFAFSRLVWDRKIQPLAYEEAKKTYVESMEQVAARAITRFFDLADAQLNLRIAQINYSNSDTLYKIAQGRYNIGTIAENDLLQMQLSYLNNKTALTKAEINLQMQKARLRSFLGYNEKVDFDLLLPDSIPQLQLDYNKTLDLAFKNNPDVVNWERRSLEARRDIAQARGERGRNIRLYASYGLTHDVTTTLPEVYQTPFQDGQQLQVGVQFPIVDWGRGKGGVKMAQSNKELIDVQIQQEKTDFEQNIFVQVMQFNLQQSQVEIAAKADTIAQNRYDVTKQRFLIGKIDVLNLNDALKEKDNSKHAYIDALRNYWSYFYNLRMITLYDFLADRALEQDFESIVK